MILEEKHRYILYVYFDVYDRHMKVVEYDNLDDILRFVKDCDFTKYFIRHLKTTTEVTEEILYAPVAQ